MLVSLNFLCNFFMINSLWIPPQAMVTLIRLAIWFIMANIVFKEGYEDMKTWNTIERKFNPVEARYRWLAFGILVMETAISVKFVKDAGHLQPDSMPIYIAVPWTIVFVLGFAFYLYLRCKKDRTVRFKEKKD